MPISFSQNHFQSSVTAANLSPLGIWVCCFTNLSFFFCIPYDAKNLLPTTTPWLMSKSYCTEFLGTDLTGICTFVSRGKSTNSQKQMRWESPIPKHHHARLWETRTHSFVGADRCNNHIWCPLTSATGCKSSPLRIKGHKAHGAQVQNWQKDRGWHLNKLEVTVTGLHRTH